MSDSSLTNVNYYKDQDIILSRSNEVKAKKLIWTVEYQEEKDDEALDFGQHFCCLYDQPSLMPPKN